jgi:hypothetical protein
MAASCKYLLTKCNQQRLFDCPQIPEKGEGAADQDEPAICDIQSTSVTFEFEFSRNKSLVAQIFQTWARSSYAVILVDSMCRVVDGSKCGEAIVSFPVL